MVRINEPCTYRFTPTVAADQVSKFSLATDKLTPTGSQISSAKATQNTSRNLNSEQTRLTEMQIKKLISMSYERQTARRYWSKTFSLTTKRKLNFFYQNKDRLE